MRRWLTGVAVILVLALAATPVTRAGPFEDGVSALDAGDHESAMRIFRELAEGGNPDAQFLVGHMYANGLGVPKDDAEAVRWFRKAAEQGDASAQNILGLRYIDGRSVPRDYAEAMKWFRKAAEKGHAGAQNNLGVSYENGQGISKDVSEAVKWYRKAAEQGYAQSQFNLGVMYANGRGVRTDNAEAAKWYRLAAEQGHADAQNNLGFKYAHGKGVPKDYVQAHMWWNLAASQGNELAPKNRDLLEIQMTPQQIAEAQRLARGWKPQSAKGRGVASGRDASTPSARTQPELAGSGTGFYISHEGHILTNAHVVDDCLLLGVEVIGKSPVVAREVARDGRNDLAVIQTKERASSFARFRAGGLRQGETVVIYGFPLSGTIASSGNATTGNVTALAGLRDDTRMLQISAPVQPGNSGGPLMDLSGAVVGIVVGKLDAAKVMEAIGDMPQNINFAIKSNIATSFLESHGLEHETVPKAKDSTIPDVTESARAFSVRVLCYR